MTNKVLLKLHHLTGTAYRIEVLDLHGRHIDDLVQVLDVPHYLVADRAYALAAERGLQVAGHTVAIVL